ncbi:MAG: metallophosphoesterase [Planctomycetota bacterium]
MADCIVLSDLHLFSRRSRADEHQRALLDAARRARTVVLAGDIVDFKWSSVGGAEATSDAARAWLEELLEAGDDVQVHYLLGNHDHLPEHIERLEALADDDDRFRWHPFHLRLGGAVFLHGDVSNPRMNPARLHAYRESFARHPNQGPAMERLYDALMALRVHVLGARVLYPERTVLRRIARYLDDIQGEIGDDVRNVYFGHTHRPVDGAEYRGIRFHNCGATIPGVDFRIVRADLS